jgi:16S rRNA (uracil1498-N3)-methyltransferase
MNLPYFYISSFEKDRPELDLDEDNSRHIVQVLRMERGEDLHLTDGKGHLITATIAEAQKKRCRVNIRSVGAAPAPARRVAVAISPLKNASRFEWFLEKATEIGVTGIIPLLTARTERQQLREDRLRHVLIGAMLQSRRVWLPDLQPLTPLPRLLEDTGHDRRLIAWMGETQESVYPAPGPAATQILIGPEGDFTAEEAASAMGKGFIPVTLGKNRLRTETAGVVAATLLCIG